MTNEFDVYDAMIRVGFPKKFLRDEWKAPEVVFKYQIPAIRDKWGGFRDYKGLLLIGPTGTKKTASLCLMARDWLRRAGSIGRKAWRFVSFVGLCSDLQEAWRDNSQKTPKEIINDLATVPFLIIDEIGAEKTTDYVVASAYQLLNKREWDELPIFGTSNLSLDQIKDKFDPRIASRLKGMCNIVEVGGEDARVKK